MNSLPFGQLKSFLKILIGVQYKKVSGAKPETFLFAVDYAFSRARVLVVRSQTSRGPKY